MDLKHFKSYCHHVNAEITERRRPGDNNHCCLFATKDSSVICSDCFFEDGNAALISSPVQFFFILFQFLPEVAL